MLLLLAQIHACQYKRAATANAFSFSSGDKNVDKTKQPEHWARLENDLKTQYRQRLTEIKPGTMPTDPDAYIISPDHLHAVLFEQGGSL